MIDIRNLELLKTKLLMYKPTKYEYLEEKIGSLYLKYIKLYVQIYNQIPDDNQVWHSLNNCYFYALNIKTPKIFNYHSEKLTDDYFSIDVGSIGGIPFLEQKAKNDLTLIKCLLADLNKLNISYYDSTINTPIRHNGYKILVLYNYESHFYHFIRQNNNGLWSTKYGLTDTIYTSDNPLIFTNDPYNNIQYEYIKTLEITKPH